MCLREIHLPSLYLPRIVSYRGLRREQSAITTATGAVAGIIVTVRFDHSAQQRFDRHYGSCRKARTEPQLPGFVSRKMIEPAVSFAAAMFPIDLSNFSAGLACIGALGLIGLIGWLIWATHSNRMREQTEEEFDQQYLARQCLNCGYDMRASVGRCPECGTKFVDRHHYLHALANDWPPTPIAPRIPAPQEQPVVLLNTKDPTEATYLQQQLLSRGIACSVRRGPPRQRFSHPELHGAVPSSVSINWNEVMVYEQDLDLAKAYLRRVQVTEENA